LSELDSKDLKTIYPKPTPRVIAKARGEIDRHAKKFIEASPFCVLRPRARMAASMPRRAAALPASSASKVPTSFCCRIAPATIASTVSKILSRVLVCCS